MDILTARLDWSLLQSFAAVGEHGSLSAAGRATGTSQPTLSRHISTLEQELGTRLFDRAATGAVLTDAGAALLQHARDMADAAARLSLASSGGEASLSGTVRITASNIVATLVLPEMLTDLRRAEPEIALEVVASDRTENLLRREADIAVRMYRPTQPDMIARKVGELRVGAFAATTYLDRRGRPCTLEDVFDHDVIGYDRSTLIIDSFRQAGMEITRDFFAFRSDNQVLCWAMVLAGYGIGFNQIQIGDAAPGIERIGRLGDVGSLPIWLTAHSELKTSARVRRVFDFLADRLSTVSV